MKIKNIAVFTSLTAVGLFCTYAYANVVSSNTPANAQTESKNVLISDATLQKNVQARIIADKTVSKLPVKITVSSGIVTLSGNINTDEEASLLIEDASSVLGVKDVDTSKLMVKESKHPYSDMVITAKIKGAFIREQLFGKTSVPMISINVETTNGTVYLTGTADTQAQADQAVIIAKSINGVTDVQSKVQVKP